VDHNTIQIGFENADDHDYPAPRIAKKYGIVFSKAGNGICHQLHLERFGRPGKTLLGSDSHTPTGGGIGMLAIGAGGIDVAVAMAGGPFYLPSPKVRGIRLTGKLPRRSQRQGRHPQGAPERFGTKGNVGWIFEYGGPGVATLDVPSARDHREHGHRTGRDDLRLPRATP
jgi:aconitate hydratase